MTPAEFKCARVSMGLTTRWLAEHWGCSERAVQRWDADRITPDGIEQDMVRMWSRFCQEVRKGQEEHADPIMVPRISRDSKDEYPASWWQAIAWQVHCETGSTILFSPLQPANQPN